MSSSRRVVINYGAGPSRTFADNTRPYRSNGPRAGEKVFRERQRDREIVVRNSPSKRDAAPRGGEAVSLYVGNLSYDVSWQDLKDHMKSMDGVVRADVIANQTGRSKGFGIVQFDSASHARAAIEQLNNTELKGRQIYIREDSKAPQHLSPSPALSHVSTSLYVGNLSYDVSWQDLKDHMRAAGDVTRADILKGRDGRSRGCGIVEYSSVSEASRAIELLNDTELKGRLIFVREDREKETEREESRGVRQREDTRGVRQRDDESVSVDGGCRVYIGNLSWDVSWQDLKDHIRDREELADVRNVDVLTERGTGRSKGCAIAEFASSRGAQRAIETLNNSELKGRQMFVREDREERK